MNTTTTITTRVPKKALVGALSMPGLGQIYNGELLKGFCFFLLFFLIPVALLRVTMLLPSQFSTVTATLSLLTALGIYVVGIIDAWRTSVTINGSFEARSINKWYFYILLWVAGAFWIGNGVASYVQKNIVQFYHIPTSSMEPGLLSGDFVIFDQTRAGRISPHKGDIIVFRYPDDRSKLYVKRIEGLPGDTLHIDTSLVIVPHGTVFVMGDNRPNAEDSRQFGPVPMVDILGKARQVYLSLGQDGIRWQRIGTVVGK